MVSLRIKRLIRRGRYGIRSIDILVILLLIAFSFFDFLNFDSLIYFSVCNFFLHLGNQLICSNYYDVKYWEGIVSIGTISAAYFAYKSLRQSNKNLTINQMPFVVLYDRLILVNRNEAFAVSIKNIGRGLAHNITVRLSPFDEETNIIDGSNPEVIHLGPGDVNSGWVLDNNEFIRQLKLKGYQGSNIIQMLKEKGVKTKNKSFLNIYLHYFDSEGNEYITQSRFQRYGVFVKVVNSDYWGMKE